MSSCPSVAGRPAADCLWLVAVVVVQMIREHCYDYDDDVGVVVVVDD